MWKKIFISIGAILLGIIGVIFGRNSNRTGVPDSDDRIGRLEDGFEELGDSNNRIRKRVRIIKRNNKTASDGISTAQDILKRAKERSDDSGS